MSTLVKTVILTSKGRFQGTEADCYVKLADNFLDQNKTYLVRLKWLHWRVNAVFTAMKNMFLSIDGFNFVDTYSDAMAIRNIFTVINCSDWKAGVTESVLYEPSAHLRKVRVASSLLRFRFYNGDTWNPLDVFTGAVDTTLNSDWTCELQFIEA